MVGRTVADDLSAVVVGTDQRGPSVFSEWHLVGKGQGEGGGVADQRGQGEGGDMADQRGP